MKRLLTTLLLIALCTHLFGQGNYVPLKEALKNPSANENVLIQPNEMGRINKFIRKLDKFYNLQAVYIQRGFDAEQLQTLISGLKDQELVEVIVECDTLKPLIKILAQLKGTDKITLIEPFIMKPAALNDIAKLQCAALSLKSSTRIKIPKDFKFPKQLEEIELLSKQPAKNYLLVDKMAGLEKLIALYISTENIATLPNNIGAIPNLKNLEIIKAKEIDKENELISQRIRMAKKANECNKLVTITYNSTAEMADTEKPVFANVFDGFYFIEDNTIETRPNYSVNNAYTPVFANAIVPRKEFSVNINKNTTIKHSSGTIISIPKNAFVDANGKPVSGEVTVSYREMKTPAEILAAGVNMVYDSAGVEYQFQSAGNFEILATQNGAELQMAKGKEIALNFLSANEGNYNLYRYDAQQQNWAYEDGANTPTTKEDIEQTTTRGTNVVYDFDSTMLLGLLDLTPFSQRFTSNEYRYILEKGQTKGGYKEMRQSRRGKKFFFTRQHTITSKRNLISLEITTSNYRADSARYITFRVYPKIGKQISIAHFPELSSLSHYNFRTVTPMTEKEFKRDFIHRKRYNDIRILYDEGASTCTLVLKHAKGYVKLIADITEGQENRIAELKINTFGKRHARYQKYLNNRITRLDIGLEYDKQRIAKQVIENREGTFGYTRYRTISINGLGLYNCDAPLLAFLRLDTYINIDITVKQKYTPPTLTDMTVKTADGLEFTPQKVYVFDETINGVFTFSPKRVEYQKNTTKKIMAVDENKNVYVTYMSVNKAVSGNTVLMKEVEKNTINTPQQLESLLAKN